MWISYLNRFLSSVVLLLHTSTIHTSTRQHQNIFYLCFSLLCLFIFIVASNCVRHSGREHMLRFIIECVANQSNDSPIEIEFIVLRIYEFKQKKNKKNRFCEWLSAGSLIRSNLIDSFIQMNKNNQRKRHVFAWEFLPISNKNSQTQH